MSLAADLVLALHVAYVSFVVGGLLIVLVGGFLGWRWTRNPVFRWGHLAAILVVVAESWLGIVCPLTVLENHLREQAGGAVSDQSFVGYWLQRLLFFDAPNWMFTAGYTAFGLLILATFTWWPPRRWQPAPSRRR